MEVRFDNTTHHRSDLSVGGNDDRTNCVRLIGAATGVAPQVIAGGDNTNIGLVVAGKGTAQVLSTAGFVPTRSAATITTAGAATYTAAQLLGGLILRDPNGAGRSDVTPTAALLAAAIPGLAVGASFRFWIRNDADAAETITVTAGTGGTVTGGGTMTIAQSNMKEFLILFTAVDAYTIYSLGTVVF